jgi:hypothetical protein
MWLAAKRSGGSPKHDGVALVVVELLKMDRSKFEKIKFKNLKKLQDLRMGMTDGGSLQKTLCLVTCSWPRGLRVVNPIVAKSTFSNV